MDLQSSTKFMYQLRKQYQKIETSMGFKIRYLAAKFIQIDYLSHKKN